MPKPRTRLRADSITAAVLGPAVAAIVAELDVPTEFGPEVSADAVEQAQSPGTAHHLDLTDIEFVTIDPPGSQDLDQAMHLSRHGDLYRIRYAIADVPAFVRPESAVDHEARRRGQTVYTPTERFSLHPPELSEGAASLLPDQVTPAYVWTIDIDAHGQTRAVNVVRSLVKSREQLTYQSVQEAFDAGRPPPAVALLSLIGPLLVEAERERGGAALTIPDQEVVPSSTVPGAYELRYRQPRPVEDWNAQISLLTGMAAADLMLGAQVGILRTLPPPDEQTLSQFRRRAAALGRPWPAELLYGEFLRSLDPTEPRELALLHASTRLFRGAGYTPFDGDVPEQVDQAAVADAYAHVTAPLRRLVDRFGLVICESICRGVDIPVWVREALPTLPGIMRDSDRLAGAVDRAGLDLAEALLLSGHQGQVFEGIVVDTGRSGHDDGGGLVQLLHPAVLARVRSSQPLELGLSVSAKLDRVDVVTRTVEFTVV